MAHGHKEKLERKFQRFSDLLPAPIAGPVNWLRSPAARWVRVPAGILLIILGFLGFLPILGFWMIPLGILLMAQDIAILRRPTRAAMTRIERKWSEWQRRKRRKPR